MTLYYPAIIRNKTSEGYRVDFLDLDDCYGVGPTEEEALADARYNAINWIQLELEDTNDLPPNGMVQGKSVLLQSQKSLPAQTCFQRILLLLLPHLLPASYRNLRTVSLSANSVCRPSLWTESAVPFPQQILLRRFHSFLPEGNDQTHVQ